MTAIDHEFVYALCGDIILVTFTLCLSFATAILLFKLCKTF